MSPFTRIAGLFSGGLDAIGAAFSDVTSQLNHESHRIAITGLQRAGKTVFVTSFAHALLNATKAPKADFPFFPWRETIQGIELRDIPGVPAFPYRERVDDLLAHAPRWPDRTVGLTGLRLRVQHTPTGLMAKTLSSKATLDLDLIDYPGEWLLDLPLLIKSFDQWSHEMEEIANSGNRAAYAKDWLDAAKAFDPEAMADTAAIERIGRLYRTYLLGCRDRLHLCYLQPGRFLVEDPAAPGAAQTFFPLSSIKTIKPGSNAAELARRYTAYQTHVKGFYGSVFGRLRKQVILVDLLTALQNGHESFADLALAIRTISEAFEGLRSPILKLLPRPSIDRLALVATKADHVTSDQLNNLIGLLRDMIGAPFFMVNARQSGLLAVASVRSTKEVALKIGGESLRFLRGTPQGRGDDVVDIRPGVIPGQIPDAAAWHEYVFNIRDFAPPKLQPPRERPLPHLNLDKVLQFLIA